MGIRITLECSCDETHYSHELDDDDFELWLDNQGILKGHGIRTLPHLGAVVEASDEWTLVTIEAPVFLEWLDALEAARTSIEGAFQRAGRPWRSAYFWSMEPELRKLGHHAATLGTMVTASWG